MADNRNRLNQSNQDWDQQRNQFNKDNEHQNSDNYSGFGNVNYDSEHNKSNRSNFGSGYTNQNRGQQMGNSQNYGGAYSSDQDNYGSFGQTGYGNQRNQGYGDNWQNSGSYGQQQRQNTNWQDNQGMASYNRGNEDWESRNVGQNYGSQYGSGYNSSNDYGNSYGRRDQNDQYGYGSNRNLGNRNRNYGNTGNDRDWWDRTKDEVSSWFGDDKAEHRRNMDKVYGPHKGKGPRDYQRSESRIREDVCDRLADDDRVDASNIHIDIQNNEVILTGTVHSREEKRRAEDLIESISGVRNVENRLKVNSSSSSYGNDFSSRDYTGNTDLTGGIGRESGTTNEIIRNENKKK